MPPLDGRRTPGSGNGSGAATAAAATASAATTTSAPDEHAIEQYLAVVGREKRLARAAVRYGDEILRRLGVGVSGRGHREFNLPWGYTDPMGLYGPDSGYIALTIHNLRSAAAAP